MENALRPSGIEAIGAVPWGTHFCQLYHTKQDLVDILVPYFKAGLENNEFCMWVTAEPLGVSEARNALAGVLPDLDHFLLKGQIEIIPHTEWYLLDGGFNDDRVLKGWVTKLEQALTKGYAGLRLTGNTFWLEKKGWQAFTDYEAKVNSIIGKYRMLAVCTYSLDKCDGAAVIDVVKNHQFALIKQEGKWDIIESAVHKQARDAQRQTEARYRSLFENMLDGYAYCRMIFEEGEPVDFTYLEVNAAFEELTGLRNVVGKNVTEVIPGIRESNPELFAVYRRVAQTTTAERFETYLEQLGTWFCVSVYSPERGYFVALFENITERKKAEEIKDAFIGMVSHELKTPLTVVTGALSVAMSEHIPAEDKKLMLEDAAWGARNMVDIVDNLLELSRWQANRLTLRAEPLDIAQVVSRMAGQSSRKSDKHRLVADVSPDLPAVDADRTRIERILENLLDNAIKYSPQGGEIRVSAKRQPDQVVFSVSDQGIGISAEDQLKLFQAFQRLDVGSSTGIQGVGLGLVVCRHLVEAHGGRIWVESVKAKGSTFYFTLPMRATGLGA